jgi:tetratricopeptide (TPR) repeat protein
VILRRIAVFPAGFDLASACAVAADGDVSMADMLDGISSLGAKSLITADVTGEQVLFGMLDTTRTYALEKLEARNETARIRRRHAELCRADLDANQSPAAAKQIADHGRKIDDVRAALDWCFSPDGDASLGVKLTVASTPLWFQFSVMEEYRSRLERALQAIEADPAPNAGLEMKLNVMLGYALMHTRGPVPSMGAFNRALEIADLLGDAVTRWQALWGLGMAHLAGGDYRSALEIAERAHLASIDLGERRAIVGDTLIASAAHFAGNQATARDHAERALGRAIRIKPALRKGVFRFDHRVGARTVLCRILWVQGFPDQAVRTAHDGVSDGLSADHVLYACMALYGASAILLWTGDVPRARGLIATLLDHSARHSLDYWHVWGRCFDAALQLRHGDTAETRGRRRELLRDPLISAPHLDTLSTLSEELVGAEAIARAETGRAGWCAAEILRAKGEIILREGAPDAACAAEILFRRSLDMARAQGALSWELRAATSLARLWRKLGRIHEAHELLAPVHARFSEGFETADLVTAKTLLEQLAA